MTHRAATVRAAAFTLIELLIVVAIIAILAAIAVPNFLEAQTRSQISRAKSDMRTMASALEAYRVDHHQYPYGDSGVHGTWKLTTPVAYIASLPADPFIDEKRDLWIYAPIYFYFGGVDKRHGAWSGFVRDFYVNTLQIPEWEARKGARAPGDAYCPANWQLRTFGPDLIINYSAPYDSTNGTRSGGDISLYGPGNPGIF